VKRILVVDDSPTLRRMVIAALRGLPDTVFLEAGNGLEAIERLAIEPVNLMVLDLNMPEMNGIDTIRFLRAHPSYRQLPVMILSTRGDEDSRRKALDLGANSYSTKPFVPGAFASEVCRLLGASCW
jgi:two-component system, chemotaxis family, chemotaxis protein CheY